VAKRICLPLRMAELQDWQREGPRPKVPQRAGLAGVARLSAIDRVADHRAAEMRQMDAGPDGCGRSQLGAQEAGHGSERRPERRSTQYSVTAIRPLLVGGPPCAAVDRMSADGGSIVPFWALARPQTTGW